MVATLRQAKWAYDTMMTYQHCRAEHVCVEGASDHWVLLAAAYCNAMKHKNENNSHTADKWEDREYEIYRRAFPHGRPFGFREVLRETVEEINSTN